MRNQSAGFTIVEIMIALTVLVSALMLTIGQYVNVTSLQRRTQATASVDRILQSLVNRVNAVSYGHLATVRAPWSIARYETLDAGQTFHVPLGSTVMGRDPMTLRAANPIDDLLTQGLASAQDTPEDLRVYVEYYRAVNFIDSAGVPHEGVLDQAGIDSGQEFRVSTLVNPLRPELGVRPAFRLSAWDPEDTAEGNCPGQRSSVMDPLHPLVIRVIAVWEDQDKDPTRFVPVQRRELFTARAP